MARTKGIPAAITLIWIASGLALAAPHPARAASEQPVPVQLATAETRDVPVFVTSPGTVTAYNSVTVRTRVDGELQQILFKEGQDVAEGQLLALIDPRTYEAELQSAKAQLQQHEATLSNARLNLTRDTELGKSDFVSVQTLDNERAKVAELEAQVASDQAAISSAATELSYTRIVSPLSGRAGLRLVDQGNIVHAGDAGGLVVINQIDPISVISTLPEQSLPAVAEAMRAGALQAQALSREDGRVLATGTVSLIDNQIDPNSGTVKLKSDFPNARDALWPGQFVDIKVRVDVLPHAVTIPASALQRGPQGLFVFAVGPDDRAQTVPVSAGQIADGTAVIETGLAPGQRVITGGQYRVRPGSLVTVSVSGEAGR
ncbi:multidrug efflux system membrane fusion protein [Azorhizobium sp. AG788]|uniref:efflux RND transporter periplasmic adaptor subunit n=1 Tax=Azorhizobium sp. AG788 TaxID=2183897 RepID=UPI0010DE0F2C|nr:efflux RND transporter periplasmic adaptor subunit [Azorhizobium sp. AG788]TDT88461.1 multidrug efflux system membrane fusion protein [Azorhizobium sp. AG788]